MNVVRPWIPFETVPLCPKPLGRKPDSVWRLPMCVNLRVRDQDRAGSVRGDQSRRDLTKVAQYEVLGNEAKRRVRPVGTNAFGVRDNRNARLLVSHALGDCKYSSIVPFLLRRPDYGGQAGTESFLKTLTQHFVLGYFRQVPAGLIFSNHQ
jgi:hypothetical protein